MREGVGHGRQTRTDGGGADLRSIWKGATAVLPKPEEGGPARTEVHSQVSGLACRVRGGATRGEEAGLMAEEEIHFGHVDWDESVGCHAAALRGDTSRRTIIWDLSAELGH